MVQAQRWEKTPSMKKGSDQSFPKSRKTCLGMDNNKGLHVGWGEWSVSLLLLYKKISTNLTAWNNKHASSHSFCGSEVWAPLSWILPTGLKSKSSSLELLSQVHVVVGRALFLAVVWLRCRFSCWLSARGHSWILEATLRVLSPSRPAL